MGDARRPYRAAAPAAMSPYPTPVTTSPPTPPPSTNELIAMPTRMSMRGCDTGPTAGMLAARPFLMTTNAVAPAARPVTTSFSRRPSFMCVSPLPLRAGPPRASLLCPADRVKQRLYLPVRGRGRSFHPCRDRGEPAGVSAECRVAAVRFALRRADDRGHAGADDRAGDAGAPCQLAVKPCEE